MYYFFLMFAVLISGPVSAHDFWIEPATFQPEVGDVLPVRLFVGDAFQGETYRRNPRHLKRFVAVDSESERAVEGSPGRDPAGHIQIDKPGCVVVGYRSNQTTFALSAGKFERYLREEGLNDVVRYRAKHGLTDQPVRESFSRCAKTIFNVGKAQGHDRILGFELELVAEKNPGRLKFGDDFLVKLLYRGEALANRRIVARSQGRPNKKVEAYTNDQGVARFELASGDTYLITSVHMILVPDDPNVDWESFWASLTFMIPDW